VFEKIAALTNRPALAIPFALRVVKYFLDDTESFEFVPIYAVKCINKVFMRFVNCPIASFLFISPCLLATAPKEEYTDSSLLIVFAGYSGAD
jgi:hypothetical protein